MGVSWTVGLRSSCCLPILMFLFPHFVVGVRMVLQASSRRVSDYQMFFHTCFQPNCCAVKWSSLLSNFPVQNSFLIGRSRGCSWCMPPQQDPILSFLHTFLPKSAHIGGWHPPPMARHPPTGNPGSAPVPGV